MAFQSWQIGLDIQKGQLCALGIQRRRHGWQLRHWWQQPLPQDTLRQGVLQSSPQLVDALSRWRKMLPRHFSLRVGLPPQLVLQRPLTLPVQALHEPELGRYVHAAARKLFPLEPESLALDYRTFSDKPGELCVTAARREILAQWEQILCNVGLQSQVFELSWAALGALAQALKLDKETVLVHRLADHWLWYAPSQTAQQVGWLAIESGDFSQLQQHFPENQSIWYSSCDPVQPAASVNLLNPFRALRLMQPPLPAMPGAFSLACGLALRPEDR